MESNSQSHGDSRRRGYPGSGALLSERHKKGVIPPLRRSARLQLHSVLSHRKPAFVSKSTLPYRDFHSNLVAQIYRRTTHKNFPFLLQDLETHRRQLAELGTDKTLEDSDDEWQSLYSTPDPSSDESDTSSHSEASEEALSAPSDTELFGLRAKSPLPSGTPSPTPSDSSSSTDSFVSATSYTETSVTDPTPSRYSPSVDLDPINHGRRPSRRG